MILTIRTDKPEAELGLYDKNGTELASETWEAHRQLAETIHLQIAKLLQFVSGDSSDLQAPSLKSINIVTGIVVYAGPGSYTGLRIGMSVGNALACSLGCQIGATKSQDWQKNGVELLTAGRGGQIAITYHEETAKNTKPPK